jgi:nicotinamidase-related amidase
MTDTTPAIEPDHAVLLVMDYQPAILESVAGADALLTRTADAIATARRHGVSIGYVRVAFVDSDYASIPATNKSFSALAGGGGFPADSPQSAVHERVAPEPGDIVVRKTRVGAFSTSDLDAQLRERGVDNLILAGVSTSGVVLSTVRDGADRDYRIFVLADGCADRDDEVHRVLTEKVFPRQAWVITIAELSDRLARSPR